VTLGNDNGTDGQTDRRTDRVRRNMRPPPREEGRIINGVYSHTPGGRTTSALLMHIFVKDTAAKVKLHRVPEKVTGNILEITFNKFTCQLRFASAREPTGGRADCYT